MFSQDWVERISAKIGRRLESREFRDELRQRIADGESARSMLEFLEKHVPEKDLTTAVADA